MVSDPNYPDHSNAGIQTRPRRTVLVSALTEPPAPAGYTDALGINHPSQPAGFTPIIGRLWLQHSGVGGGTRSTTYGSICANTTGPAPRWGSARRSITWR